MDAKTIAETLEKMASAIRVLARERDRLMTEARQYQQKLAELQTEERIEKLADIMGTRGPYAGVPREQIVQVIREKLASGESLDDLERAVSILAPDGSLGKLGSAEYATGVEAVMKQILHT